MPPQDWYGKKKQMKYVCFFVFFECQCKQHADSLSAYCESRTYCMVNIDLRTE